MVKRAIAPSESQYRYFNVLGLVNGQENDSLLAFPQIITQVGNETFS